MDIFKKFKDALKIREILIDNEVFQLHYKITAVLLLSCAALVASKQHFGDPIDCITRDDVPNKIMDTYCWIHATFTLPAACNKTVGYEIPHPCVDKYSGEREERVYHKYYQWVYFVLFFQSACFYAPHFYWKARESKLLCKLAGKFKDPLYRLGEDEKQHLRLVVSYLVRNRNRHQSYFYHFIACEVINFINVIMQIYIVDEFLGGAFTTYGLDVLNYVQMNQEDRVDPMVRVFPRMTKCSFHRFGASGDVQKYDALCILPLNIINEKIYIVMWFWFVLLAFVTAVWLIFRLLTLTQPNIRYQVLNRRASLTKSKNIIYVLKRIDTGDWFLLSMMCKNMDAQWFRQLMLSLAEELNKIAPMTNHSRRSDEGKEELMLSDSDTESGLHDDFVPELMNNQKGSEASAKVSKSVTKSVRIDQSSSCDIVCWSSQSQELAVQVSSAKAVDHSLPAV